MHTHTLSFSLTHTHTLSLSLSLTHTHTHIYTLFDSEICKSNSVLAEDSSEHSDCGSKEQKSTNVHEPQITSSRTKHARR